MDGDVFCASKYKDRRNFTGVATNIRKLLKVSRV
jgi:hypothetical protein